MKSCSCKLFRSGHPWCGIMLSWLSSLDSLRGGLTKDVAGVLGRESAGKRWGRCVRVCLWSRGEFDRGKFGRQHRASDYLFFEHL